MDSPWTTLARCPPPDHTLPTLAHSYGFGALRAMIARFFYIYGNACGAKTPYGEMSRLACLFFARFARTEDIRRAIRSNPHLA